MAEINFDNHRLVECECGYPEEEHYRCVCCNTGFKKEGSGFVEIPD